MSTSTTNLGLIKPADGEAADIDDINDNMDTIDTAIGSLRESVSKVGYVNASFVRFGTSGDIALIYIKSSDGVWYVLSFSSSGITMYKRPNGGDTTSGQTVIFQNH